MQLRYIPSLFLVLFAAVSMAQVPAEGEVYDAWKLTQIQHAQPTVHPGNSQQANGSQRDGEPCACWIEPDSTYTLALAPNDDGSSSLITLPFTFTLYGEVYNSLYINNNGNVSFVNAYGTYSSSSFPNASYKMVAPFWADVDTRGAGTVKYKLTSNALYVNWTAVGYYNSMVDKLNSFQLIISDGADPVIAGGNNVSFCFGDMQWTTGSASMGVGGFGGIPATVGANQGDGVNYLQFGRFDRDSTDWAGPYSDSSGVAWLNDRHFTFSTASATIPPIFTSIGCDTLEIEAGTSMDYPMMMIAGGLGQVVTGTSQCLGIANYVETTNSSGNFAQIVSAITPNASEVGVHAINYAALTDGSTPLTSTYTIYVKVLESTTGVNEAYPTDKISVQPNPSTSEVTLTWSVDQRPTLVQVFAADGSLVITRAPSIGASQMKLDVRALAPGLYTVRTLSEAGATSVKLVRTADQ